jgi:hypothetical protein
MGEAESEKRIFKINPDVFKISAASTRKNKQPTSKEPKIKVRAPKNQTLKNKQLLHFIRDHQAKSERNDEKPKPIKTDFEQTMEFMKQVAKTPPLPALNATLKHRVNSTTTPLTAITGVPPPIYNAPTLTSLPAPTYGGGNLQAVKPTPLYGCLKGGKLPLYRNHTFRRKDDIVAGGNPAIQISHPTPLNNIPVIQQPKQIIQAMTTKMENIANAKPRPPRKRKRTTLRRFQVGKPEGAHKISVLVSNRTIRNQISTKSQLLRQVPIQEIRKYLIKNGFIKVGSVATNDVLRAMYNSSVMMCGEIRNTNKNVLLHNYLESSGDL